MPDEFVTLATFNTPEEAHMLKNRLEAEGIRVYLSDETTIGMAWHLGTALGGLRVQVASADFERAAAVLDEAPAEDVPAELLETGLADADDADSEGCVDEDARSVGGTGQIAGAGSTLADEEEAAPTAEGDALANRAMKTAVVGIFVCPPLLHIYSLLILLHLANSPAKLSDKGERHQLIAFAIDFFVGFAALLFWLSVLAS